MVEPFTLRLFFIVASIAVPVSYVFGFKRAGDPDRLWGGVQGATRATIMGGLVVAAAAYVSYGAIVVFSFGEDRLAAMTWPWADADGHGATRVLVAYAVYLVPSALWFEATMAHLRRPRRATKALTIGVLAAAAFGAVMHLLLAVGLLLDGAPWAGLLVVCTLLMVFQAAVSDLVLWVRGFPWNVPEP